jgi:hypothetical protein
MALLTAAASLVLAGTPAAAHAPVPGGDTVLAQTIAGMEVTLTVQRTGEVPGPLRVDLIAHLPVRPLPIEVTVRSSSSTAVTAGSVRFEQGRAGTYPLVWPYARRARTGWNYAPGTNSLSFRSGWRCHGRRRPRCG